MKNHDLGYCGRYPRIYARLKAHGHDAAKALEIIISAVRGDGYALDWIRMCRRIRP